MDLGMDMWKYFGITHADHAVMDPLSLEKTEELVGLLQLPDGGLCLLGVDLHVPGALVVPAGFFLLDREFLLELFDAGRPVSCFGVELVHFLGEV